MGDWTSLLVRRSLSSGLLDECCSQFAGEAQDSARKQLVVTVNSPTDLKAAVKALKPKPTPSTREALDEEMAEIAEDVKWSKTARGRYTLAINRWIEPIHLEFRSKPQFYDVMIGGHTEREVVVATGFVQSEAIFQELLTYIESKKPPFKLWTDVRLGTWKGPKIEP